MADQIKLIIFTMHNTITNTPFVDKQPLAILPGRAEKLAELKAAGKQIALVAHAGGVAFGFSTEDKEKAEVSGIATQLHMDHWMVSFAHPKPKWGFEEYGTPERLYYRFPNPGMVKTIMEGANVKPWETLLVGMRDEDVEAAKNAECQFAYAKDFFADHQALLWSAYAQYLNAVKVTEDDTWLFKIDSKGRGAIGTDYSDWIEWNNLAQAPALIESAVKDWEEEQEEHRKRNAAQAAQATQGDDFDPFLDADDLP